MLEYLDRFTFEPGQWVAKAARVAASGKPMIEIIRCGLDDQVLGLRIGGAIVPPDLDAVADIFNRKQKRHQRLRSYAGLQGFDKMRLAAPMEDLRLSLRRFRDLEREVIVTNEGWQALLACAGNLFLGIEGRQGPQVR